MKRIESLLKIAGVKFEFQNLEICFHKRQVSFLVVKTIKCKRGITFENESHANPTCRTALHDVRGRLKSFKALSFKALCIINMIRV